LRRIPSSRHAMAQANNVPARITYQYAGRDR
jgi:hypothetical protein